MDAYFLCDKASMLLDAIKRMCSISAVHISQWDIIDKDSRFLICT